MGTCLLAVALAGIAAWQAGSGDEAQADGGHWQQPERRVLDQPLLLKGTLLPVASVNLVAPADGRLAERPVQFGDRVAAGQVVARIDSPDLLGQLRDAEVAAIRADQELEAAQRIDQSSEYQAAQRRATQAEGALNAARRRAADTQALYDKGIVARTEFEGAYQEVQSMQAQVQSAHDELAALLKKRSRDALRILQIEAQGRHEKLAELRAKERALSITTPIAGVVLYPIAGDGDAGPNGNAPKEFKPGSAVTMRDVLLSVGDTTAFIVKAWVDEQDLERLEVHQAATVMLNSDPSHELSGEVLRISSQARVQESRSGPPSAAEFEMQVLVRPPPGQALRVGALARVRMAPKATAAGLLVPLAALQWSDDGKPQLRARRGSGEAASRPVEVARTTVDAVEIRAGLDEHDEVWVPGERDRSDKPSGALKRLLRSDE